MFRTKGYAFFSRFGLKQGINFENIYNKRSKADLRSGIYHKYKVFRLSTNILEGTAFLLQGLTYNEEVKMRRYNLKIKNSMQYDTITTHEILDERKKSER